ncbi:MAG: FIST N-terminal domain-containing protein [Planctomycetota bacterium]
MTTRLPSGEPHFACALSTLADASAAAREVCKLVAERMEERPLDLAILFVSLDFADEVSEIVERISAELKPRHLVGCTGESIVGDGREIEGSPAVSLWGASLPDVDLQAMHLEFEPSAEGGSFVGWRGDPLEDEASDAVLILLGDPYSFPPDEFLQRITDQYPKMPIMGGMASGGDAPGQNRLVVDGRVVNSGAVGVKISGPVAVRSVVSQGCKPIGRPFVITKARHNVIEELGGKSPMEQLQDLFAELTPDEKQLLHRGLHVGRVINEYQDSFSRGDFLVRNVIGADPQTGALAIGDYVRPGQTVQFHVRDATTADEDFRELLGDSKVRQFSARGGLLFTCNGRGTRLFPKPHHDAEVCQQTLGSIPVAGFFAQGEIGPVGGKNFLHGFTASVVLFGAKASQANP